MSSFVIGRSPLDQTNLQKGQSGNGGRYSHFYSGDFEAILRDLESELSKEMMVRNRRQEKDSRSAYSRLQWKEGNRVR